MINGELLDKIIEESGLSIRVICKRACMTTATYYNRRRGRGEWKVSEIDGITRALSLTKKARDDIFLP